MLIVNIISFLLVFIFIVVVHEFGHYLFARIFGVKVHEFAIGFGPAIYRKKGKNTDFRINAIPLGGYVRLKGEDPAEEEDPDSLYGISAWKRLLVVLAGPVFSILAGYLLFVFIIGTWGYYPAVIDSFIEGSPAKIAGLKEGDMILKINGKYVFDNFDITEQIRKGEPVTFEVLRDGKIEKITVKPIMSQAEYSLLLDDFTGELGNVIIQVGNQPFGEEVLKVNLNKFVYFKTEEGEFGGVIRKYSVTPQRYMVGFYYGSVSPRFAKDYGIFSKGDILLKVEDMEINSSVDMIDLYTRLTLKDTQIYLEFKENRLKRVLMPLPENLRATYLSKGQEKTAVLQKSDLIKIFSEPGLFENLAQRYKSKGIQKISLAIERTNRLAFYIWRTLPKAFFGGSKEEVAGPIGMVQIIGDAARSGLETILTVVAIITINLGIFNLFPLPALDGGRIVFAAIEVITRKKLNRNIENLIHTVGFFLLLAFIIYISFLDVGRFLGR